MVCPYKFTVVQAVNHSYRYKKDDKVESQIDLLMEIQEFGLCHKEQCAVYVDGKCNRN